MSHLYILFVNSVLLIDFPEELYYSEKIHVVYTYVKPEMWYQHILTKSLNTSAKQSPPLSAYWEMCHLILIQPNDLKGWWISASVEKCEVVNLNRDSGGGGLNGFSGGP